MELYLATNYTRCPKMTNFLETKEFMTGAEHILTAICIPLNIYCIYLIWYVTPPKMDSVKFAMLHLQLVSFMYDCCMNSLLTPVSYIPTSVGSFYGLFSYLGVPQRLQTYIVHYNAFLIGMSTINVFQNRHSATITIPYRFTRTSTLIIYYTVCYLLGAIVISLYFLEDFDNDVLKLEYLKDYPCPPPEYFESTTSALSGNISLAILCVISCCCFIVTNAFYFALSTVYYLVIAPSSSVSEKTRKMQVKFLLMLTIQIVIPMMALVVTSFSAVFMIYTGLNSQKLNNIGMSIYCSHGFLSGISLIFIQTPYREYTFRFGRKNEIAKISQQKQSVVMIISHPST